MIQLAIKKPIPIEFVRFEYTQECIKELEEFMGDAMGFYSKARHIDAKAELEIMTLEDGEDQRCKHVATEGDYIVKGPMGEFWPVKAHIFQATYEVIPE